MTMPLSTLGQNQLLISEFTSLQSQLQQVQTEVATGSVAQDYGGLGAQASLDINLHQQASDLNTYNQTISILQGQTGLVDSSLGIINSTALNVQDLAFQTPATASSRQNLVSQAQAAIDQINNQLDTQAGGSNLFGGIQTQTNPMVPQSTLMPTVQTAVQTTINGAPPNLAAAIQTTVTGIFATQSNFYSGGPATAPTQIAEGLSISTSVTGADPSFKTILAGLYMIASLPQPVGTTATPPNISNSQFDATTSAAGTLISQGLSQLQNLTQINGNNESQLTSQSNQNSATLTILQTQIDNIENANLAAASTQLSQLQTQLSASYRIVANLSSLNLVNFLGSTPVG